MVNHMDCRISATSEDYVDYIVEYNRQAEVLFSLYEDDCIILVDERFAVLYRDKPEDYMQILSRLEYTIFPKVYGLMDTSSIEAVGVLNVQNENALGLTGAGTLVAVIDTGIDISNSIFRDANGRTRIVAGWDQEAFDESNSSEMPYGTTYTREDIQSYIDAGEKVLEDTDGHGIFLSGIAAGGKTENFSGIAIDAEIIVVKLKQAKNNLRNLYGIPENVNAYAENDIILGIAFARKKADELKKPLSIFIGVGSNSGSHTGSSVLESYISTLSLSKNTAVSVPGGNEGIAGHHFMGEIASDMPYEITEINVSNNDSFTLEIWGNVPNTYSVALELPGGEFIERIQPRFDRSAKITPIFGGGTIYVDYFLVEDQSGKELILMRFFNPPNGLWRVRVYGVGDTKKVFNAWLPISEFISPETRFVRPTPEITLTNPATAPFAMGVCGYNHYDDVLYINNSRGYTADNVVKPDFVAPAVNVYGPGRANTFVRRTGTSIAAAHTAGLASLMLQWALDREFLRSINGNQIRNFLIRGAERPGSQTPDVADGLNIGPFLPVRIFPNTEWGYGIVDIYNTFNSLRGV